MNVKLLEFNLRLENIQELPYKFDIVLTKEQIDIVVDYCVNDVLATELLYKETLSEINLREKLSPVYSIDFTNYNSAKLGEHIFIQKLIKSLGEEVVYDIIETDYGSKRVIKNTKRDSIDFKDVVFDYITFTTKPFQQLLKWFKTKVITETNGVFSEIPFDELIILDSYYNVETKNKKQKTLNVLYKGLQYDFGVGGVNCAPSL